MTLRGCGTAAPADGVHYTGTAMLGLALLLAAVGYLLLKRDSSGV